MDYFEVARLIFFIALSISALIVSIQLGRLLGQLIDGLKDTRKTFEKINNLVESFESDYNDIRKKLLGIIELFEKSLGAVSSLSGLGFLADMHKRFFGKQKNKKKESTDEDLSDEFSE